ncbi:hypothetical protein [Schumannella luteola]
MVFARANHASILVIFAQTSLAGIVLVITGGIVAFGFGGPGGYEGGEQVVTAILFVPLLAFCTISAALISGLVILRDPVRVEWWREHWWLVLLTTCGALGLIALACVPPFATQVWVDPNPGTGYWTPVAAWWLVIPAWLIVAFCLTNFLLPTRFHDTPADEQ